MKSSALARFTFRANIALGCFWLASAALCASDAELAQALATVPAAQRESLAFLLDNMPDRDRRNLSAPFLLENIAQAEAALAQAPWARDIPRDIFLNEILPYANATEPRDDWRADLRARCTPLIAGCATPAVAAQRLNERLFLLLKVRYSTERARADQSPAESIRSGLASCTGLSILLVDACRAVGIPARLAGIPEWPDGRGNHTWAEVWDGGRWHFLGAAEPDVRGLDHAWFERDAALAQKDVPNHAIYALSFRRTSVRFPVTWGGADPGDLSAENVTERYASPGASAGPPDPAPALREALAAFFAAPADQQADWKFDPALDRLLIPSSSDVRRVAWEAFRASPAHGDLRADRAASRVRFDRYESPYTVRSVGVKPAAGWGLVIALHGGGGAPREVNDQQWRVMQTYYRDQPQAGGYLYVALRAPNDEWNGFYDDYVYPLIANLLRQFAVCDELDLNRVNLIGYSHGGYGAFAIGPKMPDRFAAIHSSAAAPTDGETSAKTLRNTPFTFWVGERDDAYGRRPRCEAFDRLLADLRGSRRDIFPTTFSLLPGRAHSDLPDHDFLREMLPLTRNPVPRELTWEQTDGVIRDFYWLRDLHSGKRRQLDAACRDNVVQVDASRAEGPFTVFLDERLVDLTRPVTVNGAGPATTALLTPRLAVLCRGIVERGDPDLAFTVRLDLP